MKSDDVRKIRRILRDFYINSLWATDLRKGRKKAIWFFFFFNSISRVLREY